MDFHEFKLFKSWEVTEVNKKSEIHEPLVIGKNFILVPTFYKILIARVIMKYVIIIRNEKGREKFNDILKWTPDDDDDK